MSRVCILVNGARWAWLSQSLVRPGQPPKVLSLEGLQTAARLAMGRELGQTLERMEVAAAWFCRAASSPADADAVASGFQVLISPQVGQDDSGAGLSLEAIRAYVEAKPHAVLMVGANMNWQPLRERLESLDCELFEWLIPPEGKVVVNQARVLDLRQTLLAAPLAAEFAPILRDPPIQRAQPQAPSNKPEPGPANAILGQVKSLAAGYGIVTRADGGGDVEFMATQVAPPGFEFLEVGDTLRFDVVRTPGGKWQAVRVVRA